MEKLYLISGLGADRRLFDHLETPGYERVYIDWIAPDRYDSIYSYAQKIIEYYRIMPGANVLGVSLGGIVAVEISTVIALKKLIIISSIKAKREIPWYFLVFRWLPVYKIIPTSYYISIGYLIKPIFGKMNEQEEKVFVQMLQTSQPEFIKWAINAVLHWQPSKFKTRVFQIIGNKDLIFSSRRIKDASFCIANGNHYMIYNKGGEISRIVQSVLKS